MLKRISRPSHATIVAYTALILATSGSAVAANGDALRLGQGNRESRTATVKNTGGPAMRFVSPRGTAPIVVSNSVRVSKLNADLLDGRSAASFLRVGAKAADADRLDGVDSSAFQRTLEYKVVEGPILGYVNGVDCPTGWHATGGGYKLNFNSDPATRDWVEGSTPRLATFTDRPVGWTVWVENPGGTDGGTVYALCAR
jgi:hypothetical protein